MPACKARLQKGTHVQMVFAHTRVRMCTRYVHTRHARMRMTKGQPMDERDSVTTVYILNKRKL